MHHFNGKYSISLNVKMAKNLIRQVQEDLETNRYCEFCGWEGVVQDIKGTVKCPECKAILKKYTLAEIFSKSAKQMKGTKRIEGGEFTVDYLDWVYSKAFETLALEGVDVTSFLNEIFENLDKKYGKRNFSKKTDKKSIFCSDCGAKIPRNSKFCMECGYKIKKYD